jgi:hypothetical protein
MNNNGDPILATISAANILANLNHGVSYWSHWVWDQLVNFNTGYPNTRMKYMQQIGRNIHPGAIMRRCIADDSQPTYDMFWNYYDFSHPENYIQPEIVAAAAMNPDTTMTIGIVNLSGIHAQHFFSEYHADEAKLYTVHLTIEELSEFDQIPVLPIRCSNDGNISEGNTLNIINGNLNIMLASKELLVMKTGKVEAQPVSGKTMMNLQDNISFTSYPNPFSDVVSITSKLEPGSISLRLFNLQGVKVYESSEQSHPGGRFEYSLNGDGLSDGVYIGEIVVRGIKGVDVYRIKVIKKGKD